MESEFRNTEGDYFRRDISDELKVISKWEKAERSKQVFRRYIFLPLFVCCLPIVLIYSGILGTYCLNTMFECGDRHAAVVAQRKKDGRKKIMTEAYIHINREEFNDAQRMLNHLLESKRMDYWANYGMAQTLAGQCWTQGHHCALAIEYIQFTKKLSIRHHQELDELLNTVSGNIVRNGN